MTLTEQWKNKQLEWHKSYYCQNKKGDACIATLMGDDTLYSQELGGNLNFEYWEVLAPVPSYEEWQRVFYYAGKYEHEYTSCIMDYENLKQENQQLKGLLLVCREMLESYQYSEGDFTIGDNAEIDTSLLLKMIDSAIGEKK